MFNEESKDASSFSETYKFCFEIFLGGGFGLEYSTTAGVASDFIAIILLPGLGGSSIIILDPFGVPGLDGGFGRLASTSVTGDGATGSGGVIVSVARFGSDLVSVLYCSLGASPFVLFCWMIGDLKISCRLIFFGA